MNKIFRIVWNEAAQAWVAVSELTKKHKKRASATGGYSRIGDCVICSGSGE